MGKPMSWWRAILGYEAVQVIDEIDPLSPFGGCVLRSHWEWKHVPRRRIGTDRRDDRPHAA